VKYLLKNNCKPKQNVLFLKTHKTASSSIQNIFFRYGDKHKLTFVIPEGDNYFGHPEVFNRWMLYSQPTFVQHNKTLISIQNNIFAHHARYNYEEMKSIMPVDTIFVTILRDPVFVFESLVSFYNIQEIYHEKSTIQFLETFFSTSSNNSLYHTAFNKRITGRYGRNQLSFDLGLDVEHFDNLEIIRKFINIIDSQFHLIMIADRIEESLIHLRHLLCWTLDDVIVFRHNARKLNASHSLSIELQQKIRFFNNADELLYKFFDNKLTRQTEAFGKTEMENQIISLQNATKLMYDKCVEKEVHITDLILGFKQSNNTDEKCQGLTTAEFPYTDLLRKKQRLRNVGFGIYANSTNSTV